MLPGLTPEEARDLLLSVGTHHGKRRFSPVEVAQIFHKALAAGATLVSCARFVNLTGPTMVSRFLRLLKLVPEIHHLVDWGQTGATIAFASAWRLGELEQDEQKEATREVMANQMSKEEVRQIVQLRQRSRRRIVDCINEVLRMRPTLTRHHVFLGAITDDSLKRFLRCLNQSDRDDLLVGLIRSEYGIHGKTSARLGVERFTIVTDDDGAVRLKTGDTAGFETAINKALLARIPKT